MHSNVTSKNVSLPHFSWTTLYIRGCSAVPGKKPIVDITECCFPETHDRSASHYTIICKVAADWHELGLHVTAVHCPRKQSTGLAVQHADLPPLQSVSFRL